MSSIDGVDLFASGPHSIRPMAWERQLMRRGLPGVDGEVVMDMGLRSRAILQQGRLQAPTASALAAVLAAIEEYSDGKQHDLVDNHSQAFARVIIEQFEPATPLQAGRGFWCDYTLRYRQLP